MKVGKLKTKSRRIDIPIKTWGIASYGENNDYPEKVLEVSQASATGTGCLSIFIKFVRGLGFEDESLSTHIFNRKNETGDKLAAKIDKDYCTFGGVAFHVNYNALFQVAEIQHIPFEHCRIAVDNNDRPNGKIAIHPDWTGRYNYKHELPKKDQIKFYPIYNPRPEVIAAQIGESGIENYSGQVFYWSNTDQLSYPLSPFDSVVTDMATEESVSTVLYRNAKHNYLPAGILVNKKGITSSAGSDGDDNQESDTLHKDIEAWQGDEQAAKIIVVDVDQTEDPPQFVPFPIQNFDKNFDTTSKYIEANIGKVFMQPPILRGIDVGAGFGADLMKNAYDVYNSLTSDDRNIIEKIFEIILEKYTITFANTKIIPLDYPVKTVNIQPEFLADLTKNERRNLIDFEPIPDTDAEKTRLAVELGVGGTQSMVTVLTDQNLSDNQKVNLLVTLFGLNVEDANKLVSK